jgi:hypothetical protein
MARDFEWFEQGFAGDAATWDDITWVLARFSFRDGHTTRSGTALR